MSASTPSAPSRDGRSGMVTFVGVVFALAGSFNFLDGIVAIVKDEQFRSDELLFGDLAGWGVWWLLLGAAQLLAAFQILARREFGAFLGIGLAGLNMLTQLMFVGVYPAWSIAIMILDLIIIYVLSAHYLEFEGPRREVRR